MKSTLDDLLADTRLLLDDARLPGNGTDPDRDSLWKDEEITRYLNQGVEEACLRTGGIADTSTPSLVQIPIVAGVESYPIDQKIIYINSISLDSTGNSLRLIDQLYQRTDTGIPEYYKIGLQYLSFSVLPVPATNDLLHLSIMRLPISLMVNPNDCPEVIEAYQDKIIHWALYKAFSKPDTQQFDPQKAGENYSLFERYFGGVRSMRDMRFRQANRLNGGYRVRGGNF